MRSKNKLMSLSDLVAQIPNGASIGLGGSFLHRGPFAFCRELIRQKKNNIELIKASPGYDVDILCRTGVVSRVRAGIVALEGNFGLAQSYRRAVENGNVELEEHACMTLTAGLRAAGAGIPFQPVGGVHGSEIAGLNKWQKMQDPYGSGKETYLIPAISPDFAVIHAHEVDEAGNARVYGSPHWDRAMTRAAQKIFVTSERRVDTDRLRDRPELTLVPGFLVAGVSIVPNGAWPGSLEPDYPVNYDEVGAYTDLSEASLQQHMARAPECASGMRDGQ